MATPQLINSKHVYSLPSSENITSLLPQNPHRQFILDLQAWLQNLIQEGHEIILALDANESYNPDKAHQKKT